MRSLTSRSGFTSANGRFLVAILNSQRVTDLVMPYQSRGQFGARHFDKYIWYLPIPEYSPTINEHVELAKLGERAELVAAHLELPSSTHFRAARNRVREALEEDGVAGEIESLVETLLP